MNFSITINNRIINNNNLKDFSNDCEKWEKDIVDFLVEWDNDQEHVFVNSSGSTGTPKQIPLLKKDMVASAELTCAYFGLQKKNKVLLCLPSKYIAGKMMLVRAMVRNLNLISIKPESLPKFSTDEKIDFAAMTPMQVKTILKESATLLNSISQLIIGGAPVDHFLENKLQDLSTNCYSTFGMTETITHVAVKKLNGIHKSNHFEGLKNITFSTGNSNNLIIEAPHLTNSYIVTNDLVELLDDNHFKWIGRKDNVINSGGIKISPEIVETKLANFFSKNRFFITSQPDNILGEMVILVIESDEIKTPSELDFYKFLEKYEVPKKIYYSHNFTETETGKINRKETLKTINSINE